MPGAIHTKSPGAGAAGVALLLVLALGLGLGCQSPQKREEAIYGPTESVIEVIAVLRRHVPDDTYRFAPATDFTDRNVYRSTLLRLENLEKMHADTLRAGHMDAAIGFAKARSLERLRAYDLAAEHYRAAAEKSPRLRKEALTSAATVEAIDRANRVGIDLPDPFAPGAANQTLPTDPEAVVAGLDERIALLSKIVESNADNHYAHVAREEIERSDVTRARYFKALRHVIVNGSVRTVSELQRVASRHAASKEKRQHLLDAADFYALMAQEYVQANPPESLRFDPVVFEELVEAASQIYQTVASEDGTPEKLQAARRFEAFLAFTLKVDRDRFTQ